MRLIAAALLLAIFLVAGQVDSASITYKSGLRRDLCNWGAQYWCSGTKTATLCGKTEWCNKHYWQYPVISEPTCSTVHDLIKTVRKDLAILDEKPTSEYELAKVIARGCSMLKDEDSKQLCKSIVTSHEHLPKLVELIDAKLPVQSVAEAVGVCKRKQPHETLQIQKEQVDDEACITCEDVVTVTQKHARRHLSLNMYKKMVHSQCNKLGSASKACHDMAMKQYKEFYRRFVGVNPSTVCKAQKKQCVSKKGRLSPIQANSQVCATCEIIVADIRTMDRDPNVQAAIRGLVNDTCKYLGEFEKLCTVMTDEGLEYVFEIIATELEPEVVCQKLHLCSGDAKKVAEKPVLKEKVSLTGIKCSVCEFMMSEVDKMLLSNKTEEAILNILDQVCSRLPPNIAPQCEAILDQYKPLIIKILTAGLAPEKVCTFLGVCTQQIQAAGAKDKQSNDKDCAICEFVVKVIDDVLMANETEDALEKLLEHVCDRLPKKSRKDCERFVGIYSPQILALIVSNMRAEQICIMLGLCPPLADNAAIKFLPKESVKENVLCEVCEYLVTYIDEYLKKNSTEEEIEKLLDQICIRLPPEVESTCENLVKQYGPALVNLLVSGIDPAVACKSVGICNNQMVLLKESVKQDGVSCEVCEYVMAYIDKSLQKNATVEEIEQFLDRVCSLLPARFANECNDLIQQYGSIVVKLLVQGLDPTRVCSAIGLCASHIVAPKVLLKESVKQDGVSCEVCEYVMAYIDKSLQKNATVEEIEQFLDRVCSLVPASFSNECNDLIQQYGSIVVKLLVQGLDPTRVCSAIGLCCSHIVSKKEADSAVACAICETVMQQLDSLIGDKATAAEVQSALDRVCSLVPQSLQAKCTAFVDQYTPFILQIVAAEISPKEVCGLLKLCPKSNIVMANEKALNKKKKNDDECSICELAVAALDSLLEANATKEDVTAALEKVCSFLPQGLKPQCDAFVDEYASYVVDIIESDLKPEAVCKKLGLCSTRKVQTLQKEENGKVGDEMCEVCTMASTLLEGLLRQNATEEAIIQTLRKEVCERLPMKMKNQCKSMVQIYLHYVIDLVIQELPPQTICSKIGLCSDTQLAHLSEAKKLRGQPGPICIECEVLLSELQRDMKTPGFEKTAEDKIFSLCAKLPESIAPVCRQYVHDDLPFVLQLLSSYEPDALCALVGLCEKSMVKSPVKDGPQCTICEFVMVELDNILDNNATQQQIEQALEQVCNFLPASIKTQCDSFVDQYTTQLIDLLVHTPPPQVCTYLGLCTSTLKKIIPLKDGPQCTICEFVMTELDNILANNATQQQIEQALEQVCNFLPASIKTDCDNFVNKYTTQLIQLLLQTQPSQVCTYLGLCTSTQKNPSPLKDGPQCTICEFIMTELDNVLSDNATQQQIEQALEIVCNFLPASIKTECDSFVANHTTQLIQLLLQIQPSQVCAYLGLCTSTQQKVKGGPQCTLCELVMSKLDSILAANSTEQQIEQALDTVCEILPTTVKAQCEDFVHLYTPKLIQALLKFKPDEVCTRIGLCNSTKSEVRRPENAGPVCIICEFIMSELEGLLSKNATKGDITKALDLVCNFLPSSIKAECDNFVQRYSSQIIDLLLQVAPDQVCSLLSLCHERVQVMKAYPVKSGPACVLCEFVMEELKATLGKNATKEEIEQALDRVCNFLPASIKNECDAFINAYAPQIIQLLLQVEPEQVCTYLGVCSSQLKVMKASPVKSGPACVICEFVMQELKATLGKNATKEEIEQALDRVCNFLPASIKNECDAFINEYAPQIIQLLLQVEPEQVCTYLGICSSQLKIAAGPPCVICEFAMTQLEKILAANATKQQIEQALDQVCNLLPGTIKQECDAFVKQYTPTLIELLLQVTPDKACTFLRLCTNKAPGLKEDKGIKELFQCSLCKIAMGALEKMIGDNATQAQIEQSLEEVCDALPEDIRPECRQFMAEYIPRLLEILLTYKPEDVCTALAICTKKKSVSAVPKPVQAGATCVVCEAIVKEFENVVGTDVTKEKIRSFIDQACSLVPSNLKQECDQLVATFTPEILDLLLKIHPDQWCSAIRICVSNSALVTKKAQAGPLCSICQMAMSELDKILVVNATEQQIREAVEKVCTLLPDKMKPECNAFIQQYIPELINLLVKFKPQEVCAYLGLCSNGVAVFKKVQAGPNCPICELVMSEVDKILAENATEQQIEEALDKVCSLLPQTVKSTCDVFVKQYTPELLNLLLKYKPQQVCTYLGLCSADGSVSNKQVKDDACTICELALTELDNILADNATKEEIEQALSQVCVLLPNELQKQCNDFVRKYFEELVTIISLYEPHQICSLLGICPSADSASVAAKPNIGCIICDFVMVQIDEIMTENTTQEKIREFLDHACTAFPHEEWKTECTQFVDTYTEEIIELLLLLKPEDICVKLKLCPNKTAHVQTKKVTNGPQCFICEYVISELDKRLSKNASRPEIETALEQVCNSLPPTIKEQCDDLVKQYTPQLVQLLLSFKPEQVCTRLGLCSGRTVQTKKVTAGPQCILCEYAMSQLDNLLTQNSTLPEIEAALDKVCNVLHPTIRDQCEELIEQYAPQLVQLLLSFKPEEVCTRLGLCTGTKVQTKKVSDGPQCVLCEFAMSQLDKMLTQNSTQAQIEAALKQVCNFLPATIRDEYNTLVLQYTPQIIYLLTQYQPEEVCTALKLCTSKPQVLKSSGEACEICQLAMMELENILAENATQAQIEMALEVVCNLLPDTLKSECDALVKQYTPQLIELLLQFKPQEICTKLKLCPSSKLAKSKSNGPMCIICELVIHELDNLLAENSTEAQIELALEIVCNLVPESFKHECSILVEQYSEQLVQLLLNFEPEEVCTRLGLCSSASLADPSAKCYFCEFIMTELENVITSSSGVADIEVALKKVCLVLPTTLQENCKYAVEDFTPDILNLLLGKATPSQVCDLLKVCLAPTGKTPAVVKSPLTGGSDLCDFCEYVIQYLDNVLEENITRADIEVAINKLCSFVPAELKQLCDQFLEEQAETLINELEKTLNPQGLCKSAGLCNDDSSKVSALANLPKVESYEFCEFCERLIPALDELLQKDFTEEAIELALHEMCKVFDGKAQDSCQKFVTQYTPVMIEVLVTVSPDRICETLELCPAVPKPTPAIQQSKSLMFVPESEKSKDVTALDRPIKYYPYCSSCKFLMYYLQTSMVDSFWKDTAKNAMYEFCHQIKYEQDVCKILMDMNADHILGTVRGFRFPETFCQSTDMCEPPFNDDESSDHHFTNQLMLPQSAANDDFPHCDSCKSLASNLNQVASQPFWQAQLRTSLDEACDLMTYGNDVCKRLIEENIQHIITNVSSAGWPEHICQAINLCKVPVPSKKMLSTGEIACQLCGKISETANIFLKTGSSSKQIFNYLEMACSTSANAVEKERCLTIVRQYAPELLETLKTSDPKTACRTMDLCLDH